MIFAWALVLVTTARKSSWATGGMSSTYTASPVACLMADWCIMGWPTGSWGGWWGFTHCSWKKPVILLPDILMHWKLGLLYLDYLQVKENYGQLGIFSYESELINIHWVLWQGIYSWLQALTDSCPRPLPHTTWHCSCPQGCYNLVEESEHIH